MNNIKKLLLIISFLLINQLILPCTFVNQNPTNPCVLLTNGKRGCFLVFCSSATILPDKLNRAVPYPCSEITNYKIYNDFQLILGVPENRVEYHTFLEPNKSPVALTMFPYFCEKNTVDFDPDLINFPPKEETLKTESEGFLGATPVLTPGEPKQLGHVEIGDLLVAYDVESQTFKETLVININKSPLYTELVKICADQQWISCAPDQKFYLVKDKKWICAKDLKAGDNLHKRLPNKSLGLAVIDQVVIEEKSPYQTVSITLEKYHNFCLISGVIAHNCMYTVVAGTVVPLVWDLAATTIASVVNKGLQIPSSLFPKKFRELELESSLPNNKIVSREVTKERISQHQQAFFGANCSLAGADESKRNAQRVFNEVEYQYYQKNAQRLTLIAQLPWEPYRKMFSDMRNKVAQVAREKRNLVLKQTEELYKSMVQKAQERADAQKEKSPPELPVARTSSNSPDPEEECLKDDPTDGNQASIRQAFLELYNLNKKIIENSQILEKLSLKSALKTLKNIGKTLAVETLEECIKRAAELGTNTSVMPPMTIQALGSITQRGAELLSGSERTGKFYLFLRGPSEIYKATKDIPSWNISKGDYFYADISQTHDGDHIEVFHRDGTGDTPDKDLSRTAKDVRNWNSTRHSDKKKQALGYKKKGNMWTKEGMLRTIKKQLEEKYNEK